MMKLIARWVLLPFLYIFSFFKALVRLFLFIPSMFILYTLRHIWPTAIFAAVITMIFSPTFGLIVLAIGFIVKLRDIVGSTKMLVSRHFLVDWSHKKRLSDDTQFYLSDKKRKKFEKKAIKEYNKHIDEFIGFDILSDVFRKG